MADRQLDLFAVFRDVAEMRCTTCGESKPEDAFYLDRRKEGRRRTSCIRCCQEGRKAPKKPTEILPEKPCLKCKAVKPLDAFYRTKRLKDGRQTWCIECVKEYKKTPEHQEAHRKRCRAAYHTENGKARSKRNGQGKYYREATVRYRKIGKMKIAFDKWSRSEKGKKWRRRKRVTPEHRAKMNAYYYKPGVHERMKARGRRNVQKRKALKRALAATLTEAEWRATLAFFGHCCVYCGQAAKLTQDHFVPITRGGPYTRANIVPACKACNTSKLNHPPERWCQPEVYEKIKAYFRSLDQRSSTL